MGRCKSRYHSLFCCYCFDKCVKMLEILILSFVFKIKKLLFFHNANVCTVNLIFRFFFIRFYLFVDTTKFMHAHLNGCEYEWVCVCVFACLLVGCKYLWFLLLHFHFMFSTGLLSHRMFQVSKLEISLYACKHVSVVVDFAFEKSFDIYTTYISLLIQMVYTHVNAFITFWPIYCLALCVPLYICVCVTPEFSHA